MSRKLRDSTPAAGSVAGSVRSFRMSNVEKAASEIERHNDETSTQLSMQVAEAAEPTETKKDKGLRARSAEIDKFQKFHQLSKRLREIRGKLDELDKKIEESEANLAQAPVISVHVRKPCKRLSSLRLSDCSKIVQCF